MTQRRGQSVAASGWRGVLAVFFLALGVRAAYLYQIRPLGFIEFPLSDARVYVDAAREIAGGEWLAPREFFHAPLYAYVLAAIRALTGDGLIGPRLFQILVGAAGCALTMLLGRCLFGATAGLAAGVLLALYPPVIFFDGLIQKTALEVFLSALCLWTLQRCVGPPPPTASDSEVGRYGWLWHGLCLGLLILTRQNALALVPVSLAAALTGRTQNTRLKRARSRAVCVVLLLLGVLVPIGPWAVRNRIVLGEFVLTTPNLGQNFAMGNRPGSSGTYETMTRGRGTGDLEQAAWERDVSRALGRPASPREISDHYLQRALQRIGEQPGEWLRLMAWKFGGVLGAYEWPDTEDYYLYLEHVPAARWMDRAWHFGVLLPLAAAGVWLTRRQWRQIWPLHAWLVVNVLAIALFVVFARYRSPLLPALAVFAAAAGVALVEAVRRREWRRVAVAAVVLLPAALIANGWWQRPRRAMPFAHTNHAVALANLKRFPEALREFDAALALDPNNVDAHWNRGSAWFDLGEYERAVADYGFAAQRDPTFAIAWRGLGDAHLRLGEFAESERAFRRAAELDPDDPRGRNGLAAAVASQGRVDEAVEILAGLVKDRPTFAEAWLNLGNAHLVAGRLDDAVAALDEAIRLLPTYADALSSRGVADAQRGRMDLATERFRAALAADPSHRAAGRNLIDALLQQQRVAEALAEVRRMRSANPQDAELRELETQIEMRRR
ncbi:TPR repeat-containing protein YrrB [Phycisphaerae bacterium RAS1]|nr:TPR repeat-containing protein YrrB [Phycisphaerae bacterium RAS1]